MNANLTISEILTIAVVILIVFGPHRLPEMARKAGEMISRFRKMASAFRTEFTNEYGDLAQPLSDIERDLRAAKDDIKASLPQIDQIGPQAPVRPASAEPPDTEEDPAGDGPTHPDTSGDGSAGVGGGDGTDVGEVADPGRVRPPMPGTGAVDDDAFDLPDVDRAPPVDDETGS